MILDCLGRHCPVPILELAKAFEALEVGGQITVLADDPAAGPDLRAWCRMRGQELVSAAPPSYVVRRLS